LQTVSGVEMFVNQAVLQFEQFTGHAAPVAVMRQVVMEHLRS
ncbi:MAG: shikimate dehydrogenase, partial [Desulfobacterales bacterium]|nr:shikimate dehydrogenase [Desulfobacterales bacterium]